MELINKIIALNDLLAKAQLPFAFGGALALAWCTQRARGTIDIDVNVFIDQKEFETVLAVLPEEIKCTKKDRTTLKRDGQVRLWWQQTPIDLFLNNTPYHENLQERIQIEDFSGRAMPFLACQDLAVFKVFFNRTKDWADLEEMLLAGTINISDLRRIMVEFLGASDERIAKLEALQFV